MNVVVNTRQGKAQGSLAANVHTFKGIPYAAPPFGPAGFCPHGQSSRGAGTVGRRALAVAAARLKGTGNREISA